MGKKKEVIEIPGEQMSDFSSTTKIAPVIGQFPEKDELYNPADHRDKKHATSDIGSATHLIKSSLGTGILAMPLAIKNGGLIVGAIGTVIIGMLCAHCVHILVKSSHVLCRKTKKPFLSYADTAQVAFECGPKPIRGYGNFARKFVDWALCATYMGGCCVYVVFIADSVRELGNYYLGNKIDIRYYILAIAPALIGLGQIRNLKILVPFSITANVTLTSGFAVALYYIFVQGLKPLDQVDVVFSSWRDFPKFFATVIFAIEGIGTVMPIENSMANPSHFIGCPSVLNVSMAVVIFLYAMMGLSGYMCYGKEAQGNIALNMPINETGARVGKILVLLAITLTYGLQIFVPLDISWKVVKNKFSHSWTMIGSTIVRFLVVMMTVCIALLVPNIALFISLVGSVFFSILGFFIPAVIETVSCWDEHLGKFYWRLFKNILLIIVASAALFIGTSMSIVDIIEFYSKPLNATGVEPKSLILKSLGVYSNESLTL